jgi:hypothetical protein
MRPVRVRSQREGISGQCVVAMAPARCCSQEQKGDTQIRRTARSRERMPGARAAWGGERTRLRPGLREINSLTHGVLWGAGVARWHPGVAKLLSGSARLLPGVARSLPGSASLRLLHRGGIVCVNDQAWTKRRHDGEYFGVGPVPNTEV